MIFSVIVVIVSALYVRAIYDPASGADWMRLRPTSKKPIGSLESLPFSFGIVVNPYIQEDDGGNQSLSVKYRPLKQTVTFTQTTTLSASKPTVTADLHQIEDGQIQRIQNSVKRNDDSDCDNGDSDDDGDWGDSSDDDYYEGEEFDNSESRTDFGDGFGNEFDDMQWDRENNINVGDTDDFVDWNEARRQSSFRGIVNIQHPSDLSKRINLSSQSRFLSRKLNIRSSHEAFGKSVVHALSCISNTTLTLTLKDGILRDGQNRIGSIVGNHQFQFDGPLPQYGTIFAAGWSVTRKGSLALGHSSLFYQCSSGEFYNIYNKPIGSHCQPVQLDAVELIECP